MDQQERKLYVSNYFRHIIKNQKVFLYNSFTGDWLKTNIESLKIIEHIKEKNSISQFTNRKDYEQISKLISALVNKRIISYDNAEDSYKNFSEKDLLNNEVRHGAHIRNLRLNVTEQCNMDCDYCFEKVSNIYTKRRTMNDEIMKISIKNFLDIIKKNNNNSCTIQFFGGEPLLNWNIVENAINYANSMANNEIMLGYLLNTNGVLLTDEICDVLNKNDVTVIISLDGYKEYNDKYRKFPNGQGNFDIVDKKLDLLAKHNCKTNVALVCTDNNYEHLNEFVDYIYCKKEKLQHNFRIAFSNVHISDRKGIVSLPYEKRVQLLMEAIHYARQKNIECFGGLSHNNINNLIKPNGGRHCVCLGSELSVNPDASVNPCYGISTKLGDIQDIDKIFQNKEYLDLVMRVKENIKECKNCDIEAYCAGGCYGEYLSDSGKKSCTYRDCDLERLMFKELVKEYLL